ncbi:hypothetical protein GUJ93_ZPchr0008g13012 [Zizania palustris]|uniref:Uncharacterized protein n=1 Tax=Zizania palustris TaxID=103762 RepID=A0A8J5RHB2_ZIZPA|nr:hypothetical protein GUJ93_ZPchr0008g13012 [Zizania palustris]
MGGDVWLDGDRMGACFGVGEVIGGDNTCNDVNGMGWYLILVSDRWWMGNTRWSERCSSHGVRAWTRRQRRVRACAAWLAWAVYDAAGDSVRTHGLIGAARFGRDAGEVARERSEGAGAAWSGSARLGWLTGVVVQCAGEGGAAHWRRWRFARLGRRTDAVVVEALVLVQGQRRHGRAVRRRSPSGAVRSGGGIAVREQLA